MKLGHIVIVPIIICAALLSGGKTAAAAGEYGALTHFISLEGPSETGLEIRFYGGYTGGSFNLADFAGEYRVALGASDCFQRVGSLSPVEEGRFYLVDLSGGVRLGIEDQYQLALLAGALFVWGRDEAGSSYQYLLGRAGIGLAKRFQLGRISLATEGDVFLALAYLDDRIDLGGALTLQGVGIEGGLNAALPLEGGLVLLCGLHCSLAIGRDLFSEASESGISREIAVWLGASF